MMGPVLPNQPPTAWNAAASDLLTGVHVRREACVTVTGVLAGVVARARLINDFIGVGLGITAVDAADVVCVHAATAVPHAPIAAIGAGTGLGEVGPTNEAIVMMLAGVPDVGCGGAAVRGVAERGRHDGIPRTHAGGALQHAMQ